MDISKSSQNGSEELVSSDQTKDRSTVQDNSNNSKGQLTASKCLLRFRNEPRRVLSDCEFSDLWLSVGKKFLNKLPACSEPQENIINRAPVFNWDQYYHFPRLLFHDEQSNKSLPFALQPSLFHGNHVPPTIYFTSRFGDHSSPPVGPPEKINKHMRWKFSHITPNSIRSCVAFTRFVTLDSRSTDNYYLGSWAKHMLVKGFSTIKEKQKINHIPGSFHLGRKDRLSSRLSMASNNFGSDKFGNFHPETFLLPRDYDKLKDYWNSSKSKLFIMKPPASSRGKGVEVINNISQIPVCATKPSSRNKLLIQEYLSRPLLLENGKKFDLRIYVLITNMDPLKIYIHNQGLVRFASSNYSNQQEGDIDPFMHLTNYCINKNHSEYMINNDHNSLDGSKWALTRFWAYLKQTFPDLDVQKLRSNIIDIIVKTIICCEEPMTRLSNQYSRNDYNCYELFGFDVMLDQDFKPWILEVNITPSLKSESDLDFQVKSRVIMDMFNLVGYNLPLNEMDKMYNQNFRLGFDRRCYKRILTKHDRHKQCEYLIHLSQGRLSPDAQPAQLRSSLSRYALKNGKLPGPKYARSRDRSPINLSERSNFSDINELYDDDDTTTPIKSIIDDLTQNDIRVLMLAEDELSRRGGFERVFPAENSKEYLRFFEESRYYNHLLCTWDQEYRNKRSHGIERLASLAYFLDNPLA